MALHLAPTALVKPCAPARLPGLVVKSVRFNLGSAAAAAPLRRSVISAAEGKKSSTVDTDELINTIQEKWGEVEDKNSFIAYSAGALGALWIASSVVNAFNGIPLLPKVFELVGLVYASWFVYRYLLFKSSRAELADDIDELKKKVTGGDQ